ncbi:hypothetical protein GCU67_03365 [Modestobacter muralis]|uniref:Uncharacterized protein n=1 Tax=Modestobacter muralis TaxID=1608614 RepID=A0A6P0H5K4_9ACTN|nr:hypothetical protein [Modestobacter muralis]NEK93219.1 hypothetical protein [Modestobacter muralis]NEN49986.1 hypothetical protein [Modestobacter muralis]
MSAPGKSQRRWPTTPGGAASTPEQVAAAEAAVADLLTCPEPSGRPLDGGHLLLSYLPFTDLDRSQGLDLSWETQVERRSPGQGTTRMEIGGGATPAEAVEALVPSRAEMALDEDAAASWSADARDLERRWAGWGQLLRQATAVAAAGPATPEEPSSTGFDMEVRWDDDASPPDWEWTVSVSLIDTDGEDVGFREWRGTSPADALRAALADADEWYRPVPARPRTSHGEWTRRLPARARTVLGRLLSRSRPR